MAALLEEEAAAYPELRRGEIIEGVVVGTDRDGILVDIGAKSEGVVPPHEMHCLQPEGPSRLNQGDKVLVFIVQPESPEGQIILSLDRARGERGWRVLQDYLDQNQAFEGYITGSNKGGLLVNVEGVNAFVPLSQLVSAPERGSPENTQQALSQWVGKNITLKVIELNRRRNRAILSERSALQEKRAAEKERLLLELHEGDVRTGRITSIRDFGIFVDIGGADGLVHLSELSWERTPKSPHELFKSGDEISVYILKVDSETKKIALSVRRAQPERWEEIVSGYREGQIVPGQVTKLAPFGAFVRLEGPIEGLIHISELVDRRINHPKEVVEEGDVLPVKVVRIEYDRHRLGLSLRQARDKSEEDGWTFSESGRPMSAPQEALDKLGVTAPPVREDPPVLDDYADTQVDAEVDNEGLAETAAAEDTTTPQTDVAEAEAAEDAPVDEAQPELEAAEPETAEAVEEETEPEAVESPSEEAQSEVTEPIAEEAELESEDVAEAEAVEHAPVDEAQPEVEATESETADEPAAEEAAAEEPVDEEPETVEAVDEEATERIAEEAGTETEHLAEPEASEQESPDDEPSADEPAFDAPEVPDEASEEPEASLEESAELQGEDNSGQADSQTETELEPQDVPTDVTEEPPEALNKLDEELS